MRRNSLFNVITLITAICDEGNYSFIKVLAYLLSSCFGKMSVCVLFQMTYFPRA